jgi:hypothetical protein
MRIVLTSLILLLCAESCHAFSWPFMSPQELIKQSDLIALVTVSTVHDTASPEGIHIVSAVAKIDQLIYRQHFITDDTVETREQLPSQIIIYDVDANPGRTDAGPLFIPSDEGRCFVCLKARGFGKFYPYHPLSVQKVIHEKIFWPAQVVNEETPLQSVIKQLDGLIPK